ncbi:unnamed protein product [Sphenostylis stenocarpa]|uniref:Uncharacterized protein n=1 Tax=Sphenostylis stenocarpa TaxID=92480 RepID=A0AA86SXK0_9FABA|nr:unnamed protein product [Sphenostylis stenocarpa]
MDKARVGGWCKRREDTVSQRAIDLKGCASATITVLRFAMLKASIVESVADFVDAVSAPGTCCMFRFHGTKSSETAPFSSLSCSIITANVVVAVLSLKIVLLAVKGLNFDSGAMYSDRLFVYHVPKTLNRATSRDLSLPVVIPMDDEVGEACGEGGGSPTLQILPLILKGNFVVVLLEATKN